MADDTMNDPGQPTEEDRARLHELFAKLKTRIAERQAAERQATAERHAVAYGEAGEMKEAEPIGLTQEARTYMANNIYILIVEHHNGRDVYPCATEERAWQRLDDYVCEWWSSTRGRIASEVVNPTPGDPSSMTQQERIETFYDYWQGKGVVEQWEIEEYEVLE